MFGLRFIQRYSNENLQDYVVFVAAFSSVMSFVLSVPHGALRSHNLQKRTNFSPEFECPGHWCVMQVFQVRKPVLPRRRLLAFAVQTVQQGLRVTSGGQI